nr:excalibur calcium-binding domain-containing protein [Acidipropionibacterium virtanenii]
MPTATSPQVTWTPKATPPKATVPKAPAPKPTKAATTAATAAPTRARTSAPRRAAAPRTTSTEATTDAGSGSDAYYQNCSAARAAGVAPLHRGDPGYSTKLDRDGDGVACE